MRHPILTAAEASKAGFLQFWDSHYTGYDEAFYVQNLGKPLTPERISSWFAWKNGTPLSPLKAKSILRYSELAERIASDVDSRTLREFLSRPGGPIWRIFWLHVQHPSQFPIYDQHVHRAMAYLLGWKDLELPAQNPKKVVTFYLDNYRAFFRDFEQFPARQVDRALWAFGKFLSNYANMVTGRADVGDVQSSTHGK